MRLIHPFIAFILYLSNVLGSSGPYRSCTLTTVDMMWPKPKQTNVLFHCSLSGYETMVLTTHSLRLVRFMTEYYSWKEGMSNIEVNLLFPCQKYLQILHIFKKWRNDFTPSFTSFFYIKVQIWLCMYTYWLRAWWMGVVLLLTSFIPVLFNQFIVT